MDEFDLNALFNDPELMRQLSEMGVFGDEHALLNQQMARAQALRQAPTPEGRNVGGTFQAANPLEFAAALGQRIQGASQTRDLEGQQKELLGRQRSASQALADAIRRGYQPDLQGLVAPRME